MTCPACNDTQLVEEDTGGVYPDGRAISAWVDCPECSYCYCGLRMIDHRPYGQCTTPRTMYRENRTDITCRACDNMRTYGPPTGPDAYEIITKMLPFVEWTYECIHPDEKYNQSVVQEAKTWLENHQ